MSRITAFCLGVMAVFAVPAAVAWTTVGIGALVLGAMMWGMAKYGGWRWAAGVCLAAALGATYAGVRTHYALSQQFPAAAQSQTFQIQITNLPEKHPKYTRFIAQATDENGQIYRLQLQDYSQRDWRVGEHWQIQARVRAAIGTRNQVGFDREAWALANQIDGIGSVGKTRFRLPETSWVGFQGLREHWVQQWRGTASIFPQGSALMKALAVGDDSALSSAAWAAFRPLGLNHLISISGLHITMVAMLFGVGVKALLRIWPIAPRRPRVWVLAMSWLAAAVYTALAGAEIPALRSLLMLTVFAWAWTWRSHWGSWRIFWTAMAVVLLYQPMAVLSVGFALSFGLVAALLWVGAFRLPENPESAWQRRYHAFKLAVKAQWAATLVGGLANVYLFGLLPVFSPVVNAFAIPFFSILLTPLALMATVLPFDFVKYGAAYLGEYTVNLLIFLGNRLPEMPFTQAPVALLILALAGSAWILLPSGGRGKCFALMGLLPMLFYQAPPVSGSLKAIVYDVGQGLAVSLQTPNHRVLYDTGTPAADLALLPNLRAAGVREWDAVIVSHHDDDHDGGLPELQKHFPINQLYAGQPEFYPQAQPCHAAQSWQHDGVQFQFLTLPKHLQNSQKDNDLSCVLRVATPHGALLLTGDISQNTEAQLIEQHYEKLKSEVLILAHHGSQSSNSGAFLRAVSPQVAVASSGFGNAFRHPSAAVQRRLSALRIQLLRTDWQGGVVLHFGEDGVRYQLLAAHKKWWQRKPFEM